MVSGAGVIDNAGPITGTGIVNIPAGGSLTAANLNVGDIAGNGVFGTVQVAGGQFAAASGAYLIMGNLQITGGTATLADGQTMLVNGSDPTWSDPAGMGLRIAAGGTFNLSGGSLIINGTAGPSEISVGDSTIGGSGSGPAVFNLSGGTLYAGLFGSEAGNFGLNGGNTMGLVVGSYGTTGIFNQTGGLNIVHGYGYFAVGSDCWFDTSAAGGTGTYNLSGGILNTSEGAGNWGDYSKWSIVGFLGGSGTVNVSQSGVWQISDDTTYRPLAIATGNPVGEFTGPGTFGDVEITNGGQVYAHAGVMIGNVFATSGGGNFQGATGILNVAGGLLDAGGFPIYIGPGGSFTVSTGTLQNIGEIMGNAAVGHRHRHPHQRHAAALGYERQRTPAPERPQQHLHRRHDHQQRHRPGRQRLHAGLDRQRPHRQQQRPGPRWRRRRRLHQRQWRRDSSGPRPHVPDRHDQHLY